MYTPDDIETYKQALLVRQREADDSILDLTNRCEPDETDPAVARAAQDQQVAQRRRLNMQQTRIKTALDRIRKGEFGICPLCKEPIGPSHLDLVPESPLCAPCLNKRNATRRPGTGADW
jgi:RNA polymerase-binding transcription factor DksA